MKKKLRSFSLCLLGIALTNLYGQTPPPQAVAAGYTKLAFSDEFNSISTIDMDDTRTSGFNWYRARPFGWASIPKANVSVANGVLTINSTGGPNYGIGSTCKNGSSFNGFAATDGAYFEASVSFDHNVTGAAGWPSFWTMATEHLWGPTNANFIECDFMEFLDVGSSKSRYIGALHWWTGGGNQEYNLGNWHINTGTIDWKNTFNTVGTLWKPGTSIDFYFNNTLKTTNAYSTYPWLKNGADNQHWPLILGSDGWPMKVDWVRVWVKDTTGCTGKPVTGVTMNKATTSIQICQTEQLSAVISPADACNPSVTWTSSNTAVATVNSSGLITAVAVGTANITVKTNDGSFTKTCAVTVTAIQTAYNNATRTIPGRIEAEDYDTGGECVAYHDTDVGNNGTQYRTENVDIKVSGDAQGGGYDIGWGSNGEWLEYTLDATAGTYNMNVRVGSASSGGSVTVKLDGLTLGTVTAPNLGNWNDKSTQTISNVTIAGGAKKILRLEIAGSGGVDINWIEFTSTTTGINSQQIALENAVYPNPSNGFFSINYEGAGKNTLLTVTDKLGRTVLTRKYETQEINDPLDLSQFPKGIYTLKLEGENQIKTMKLIKL